MRDALLVSIGAGLALAVAYTASPLMLWVVVLGVAGFRLSLRGLPDGERRLLATLLAAAVAARLILIALIFFRNIPFHHDQFLGVFTGDDAYGMARGLRGRDLLLHAPTNKFDGFILSDMYGANLYNDVLIVLQVLFGPTPYSMRLLNALLFVAGAVVLFRFARSAFGRLPAFAALTLVLFLPSFFLWSISLLKEPLYFFCTAVFLVTSARALRGPSMRDRTIAAAAALAALVVMEAVRHHTMAIGLLGSAVAVALWMIFTRPRRYLPLAAVACAVMLALVAWPPVQRRVLTGLEDAAKIQAGHIFTVGHGYRVLDAGFYYRAQNAASSTLTLTPEEAARFVLRAIASFVATPLPWQSISMRELAYVPEQLVWYALVALLPLGIAAGVRRDPAGIAALIGYALPTSLVLALTNGNVGTIVRLRGMIMIIVVWISALGLCMLLDRARSRLHVDWRPAQPETAS